MTSQIGKMEESNQFKNFVPQVFVCNPTFDSRSCFGFPCNNETCENSGDKNTNKKKHMLTIMKCARALCHLNPLYAAGGWLQFETSYGKRLPGGGATKQLVCVITLLGINISLPKALLEMSFFFPRWDMWVFWKVVACSCWWCCSRGGHRYVKIL